MAEPQEPPADLAEWFARHPAPPIPPKVVADLDRVLAELVDTRPQVTDPFTDDVDSELDPIRVPTDVTDLSEYALWAQDSTGVAADPNQDLPPAPPLTSEVTVMRAPERKLRRWPSALLIAAAFSLLGYAGTLWLQAGDEPLSAAADSETASTVEELIPAPASDPGGMTSQGQPGSSGVQSQQADNLDRMRAGLNSSSSDGELNNRVEIGRILAKGRAGLLDVRGDLRQATENGCSPIPHPEPIGPYALGAKAGRVAAAAGHYAVTVPAQGSRPSLVQVYACGRPLFPVFQFYPLY